MNAEQTRVLWAMCCLLHSCESCAQQLPAPLCLGALLWDRLAPKLGAVYSRGCAQLGTGVKQQWCSSGHSHP